jgi:hypothetical protein
MPFSHIKSDASVILSVVAGGRPKREGCLLITNDIWAMLEACWDVEPNRRPSMTTVSRFFALRVTPVAACCARL